jgi:hypothetical protein
MRSLNLSVRTQRDPPTRSDSARPVAPPGTTRPHNPRPPRFARPWIVSGSAGTYPAFALRDIGDSLGVPAPTALRCRYRSLIEHVCDASIRLASIGSITFHSLRRTYASLRCACADDMRHVSAQIGHEDPRFTLKVYAQATKRRDRLSEQHRRAYDRAIAWAQIRSWSVCPPLRRQQKTRPRAGPSEKRMKGLEPSTFCMASESWEELGAR